MPCRGAYHWRVGLVRTWTIQLARAAGASLIAPLVLLLASGAVASGGGLGSVGSLREIASGPTTPDIGLAAPSGSALADAEIVGADLPAPADVAKPPAPPRNALASATAPASAEAPNAVSVTTPGAGKSEPPAEPIALRDAPGRSGDGAAPPSDPPPAPPAPAPAPAPAPVEDLLNGLGDTLREPLRPLTDTILNLVGQPPRR